MATRKADRPEDSAADLSGRIHQAAYYHWQGRGGPHGTALEDWLYAERLILGAVSEPEEASAGPGVTVESPAASASRHVPVHVTVKKASPIAAARVKVASGLESVAEKPKRKSIPKVKKSSSS